MRTWWEGASEDVLVPVAVLPEITYLLSRRLGSGAELAFVEALAAGEFVTEPLLPEDIARSAELMAAYGDTPLGFVDSAVASMAERLGVARLLTTDRRHFSLIRPRHLPAFRLLP